MIDAVNNINVGAAAGAGATPASPAQKSTSASGFADVLKNSIDEVAKLQQDASKAVEDLATGRSEDVTGVMMAVEKSDLAFKTLLAIRAKLMDAYDEIKNMPI
jgi:flagellar hook-basal body complex protein FliE